MEIQDPRYPVGRYDAPREFDSELRKKLVHELAKLPAELRAAVQGLGEYDLEISYRAGGWSLRQVVHHLADAFANAYVRIKFLLTESEPSIMVWNEERWVETPENHSAPIDSSLDLFDATIRRLVSCLELLPAESFERTLFHPSMGVMTLNEVLSLNVWHGRHHVGHLKAGRTLLKR